MTWRGAGALMLALWAGAAHASDYATVGRCDGYRQVDVPTRPSHCVALVADASNGLRRPRRILEVAPGRFWIIDMGNWEPRRGRLLELLADAPEGTALRVLASGLDRPHALVRGPDGKVYVGEAGRIWRTAVGTDAVREEVLGDLPDNGAHPLKELAFGPAATDGSVPMYVGVGSFTDDCRGSAATAPLPCDEREGDLPRAAVRVVTLAGPTLQVRGVRTFAQGLRNSLALTYTAGGALLQGDNGIDYADLGRPADTLNHLVDGADFGWPFCVAVPGAARREFARQYAGRRTCDGVTPPLQAWPAHVAPLQLLAVPAGVPGELAGRLVIVWHGYRPQGHRVLVQALDARGLPTGRAEPWLSGWDAIDDHRPMGTPAGATVDHRGRLWVVEDRNHTVLMVGSATTADCSAAPAQAASSAQ